MVNPSGTLLRHRMEPPARAADVSNTSSIRVDSSKCSRLGGASWARPYFSVWAQKSMARSIDAISLGANFCTVGSCTLPSLSVISWALASMLRRSWLILLTASPSAARWLFCCSMPASSLCICASCCSAVPISSCRLLGVMM